MRVDEKTKEVLTTWPFSAIRRWAATLNSFVLVTDKFFTFVVKHVQINVGLFQDFGSYSQSTYSVQTPEGKAICRLISGYVDLLTRKHCSQHEVQRYY